MTVDPFNDITSTGTATTGGSPMNLEYVQGSGNTFVEKPTAATGNKPAAVPASTTEDEDVKKYGFKPTVTEKDATGKETTRPMTNTEFGNEWSKQNPEPTKREVKAPEITHKYDWSSILKKYEPKEDTEQERKRQRSRRNLAALTDGINSIINLIGATKNAPSVYDPSKNTLSMLNEREAKVKAQQEKDRETYRKLLEKGAELEQNENLKKLSLYNTEAAKANDDYAKALALHNTKRNQAVTNYDKDQDNKRSAEHNAEIEKQGRDRLEETKRHNKATEGIAKERNSISREKDDDKKDTEPTRFAGSQGTVYRKKTPDQPELDNIIGEMKAAGVYGNSNPFPLLAKNIKTRGQLIQQGMNTAAGLAIMLRHGFKKQ